MIPHIDLNSFMERFNHSKVAYFLTNASGFIVEVNQSAASLFDSEIPHLKNKSLRTFLADRKNSQERFDGLRIQMEAIDSQESKNIMVRTQPLGGKKRMIRTNVSCEVIGRSNRIILILWKFEDADRVDIADRYIDSVIGHARAR